MLNPFQCEYKNMHNIFMLIKTAYMQYEYYMRKLLVSRMIHCYVMYGAGIL